METNKTTLGGLEERLTALREETGALGEKNAANKARDEALKAGNKELNEQRTALQAKLRFIEENVSGVALIELVRFPGESEEDELRGFQDIVPVEHDGEPDDAAVRGEAVEGEEGPSGPLCFLIINKMEEAKIADEPKIEEVKDEESKTAPPKVSPEDIMMRQKQMEMLASAFKGGKA